MVLGSATTTRGIMLRARVVPIIIAAGSGVIQVGRSLRLHCRSRVPPVGGWGGTRFPAQDAVSPARHAAIPVVWVAALLPQAVLPRHWQGCALGLLLLLRLRHWPLKQLEVLQEALTLLALPLPGQDEQGRLCAPRPLQHHARLLRSHCQHHHSTELGPQFLATPVGAPHALDDTCSAMHGQECSKHGPCLPPPPSSLQSASCSIEAQGTHMRRARPPHAPQRLHDHDRVLPPPVRKLLAHLQRAPCTL
mmetsp:Transcript_28183/g.76075  ORF Transcript_28183/g.76075 Transcript_28183/m.76075 type:complete len:249 (+) Transcript_28183:1114-1860(+)